MKDPEDIPEWSLSLMFVRMPRPEPHILLFRRPLGTDPVTGKVDPELEREAKEKYAEELSGGSRK